MMNLKQQVWQICNDLLASKQLITSHNVMQKIPGVIVAIEDVAQLIADWRLARLQQQANSNDELLCVKAEIKVLKKAVGRL